MKRKRTDDKRDRVWVVGVGDNGELGLGSSIVATRACQPIPMDDVSKEVAVGSLHSVILSDSGKCYGWGSNDDGALGKPRDEKDKNSFCPRPIL